MSEPTETSSSLGSTLLTFLAGAAIGAVVVALTIPKSGPHNRHDLKKLGRRARRKAELLGEEAASAWASLKTHAGCKPDGFDPERTEPVNHARN